MTILQFPVQIMDGDMDGQWMIKRPCERLTGNLTRNKGEPHRWTHSQDITKTERLEVSSLLMGFTGSKQYHLGRALPQKVNWDQNEPLELIASSQEIQRAVERIKLCREDAAAKSRPQNHLQEKWPGFRNKLVAYKQRWLRGSHRIRDSKIRLNAVCGPCWALRLINYGLKDTLHVDNIHKSCQFG